MTDDSDRTTDTGPAGSTGRVGVWFVGAKG